ncbi:hypothetical protein F2Q70_00011228 [Brassica cretica]|uniref:Transmembrane protein n=2 Tax=Brassica cretica TaxID=69181 RepID=A0A8S9JL85_BRACR|nr:hypothetical protein F2Q68_00004360 [Brassica cretica]KAF2612201.1 hypothetical protein F2Q70_00011228 [Brassica cretica]KAF3544234.1 hypothetical protein DY000_02006368 [Brassica cretica]
MCPSSWFQLGSASVLLVGRFSTQISSCSRLAARGPSVRPSRSRIRVISNSGSLSELCIHRGLRWLRVELFLGGELALLLGGSSGGGAWRCVNSDSCSRCLAGLLSSKLRFSGGVAFTVAVFSWALRLLSHSVKLLWRWGFCPVRLLYMSSRFNGYNGPGYEVWRRQSLSLRLNDGIVGWCLCLVPPGYVDLVLVCMFVLVILGAVSVL